MNDKQERIVELYLQGETITNIAKIIGCSRMSIYNNLKDKKVKAAIDEGLASSRKNISDKITASSEVYINELAKIALTSKDEKLRAQCLQYMLDHTIGKATTKIENTASSSDKNEVVDINDMLKELEDNDEDIDNVVELPKRKAK